jgi:hypothetical protein
MKGETVMANVKTNLSTADAALVRDCELEAQDADNIGKDLAAGGNGEGPSLCSLGRDCDYTPYSDDVEENILHRLATLAIDEHWVDCARVEYGARVEEIFGSVPQRALDFFKQRLIDEGLAA